MSDSEGVVAAMLRPRAIAKADQALATVDGSLAEFRLEPMSAVE
jgi:hypothetical protein